MLSRRFLTRILSMFLCGLFVAQTSWAQQTTKKKKAYEEKTVQKTKAVKRTAAVKPDKKKSRFLRVVRDKANTPLSLQTAVASYEKGSGDKKVTVYLVGAVHIGDRAYYRQLNREFENYDVVLYELVAPKGTRIEKDSRKKSPFNSIVKKLMKLETQVARIDYTKKNFVHADMTPKEISEAMKKRGDDPLTIALSVVADMMRQQNKRMKKAKDGKGRPIPQISLFTLLVDPKRHLKLKRIMAEEFDVADPSEGLGETLNRMLIDDRNEAAMKVFQKELKKGHKKIAIFYGAAHLPDFEKRLTKDHGFKKKKVEWFTAWDLED